MTSTVTSTTERKPAAERVAVRCVDSDVHPTPKSGVLAQYIPEPWRSKYFLSKRTGDTIYYDAPDYAHSYAMRVDTFPPDGEFAGSDPDMAFRQLIMEAGSDIARFADPDPVRFKADTKDVRFAKFLVEKIGVAVVPGSSFYNNARDGASQVRFTFCKKEETLAAAEERLAKLHA